jgi:hypothetical protein
VRELSISHTSLLGGKTIQRLAESLERHRTKTVNEMYPFTESPSLTLYGREETNETDSTYFWELALPPNSKFLLDDERFFAALRMQEPPTSIHNETQGDLFGYENLSGTETEYIQSDPVDPNELFSSYFPYSTTPKK